MKMQIFHVENLQKGWIKIREELGENAIILSIKENNGKFEILAASPEKKEHPDKNRNYLSRYKNIVSSEEEVERYHPVLEIISNLKKGAIPKKLEKDILGEIQKIYSKVVENLRNIDFYEKIEQNPLKKKYVTVLGNISSGKSTTIAKLGAILKFNKGRKIAIASFDFYKIGGSESLKKFSEIMQIPFFLIKNDKDLILYKDAFDEFDHILFDTPGNIKQLTEVERIVSFITNSSQSENILTIPLTRKENIIEKDMNYFSKFNIDHLILTKYDEIENLLPVFFIISNWNYKISYITDGMDVPKDIKEAKEIIPELQEVYR